MHSDAFRSVLSSFQRKHCAVLIALVALSMASCATGREIAEACLVDNVGGAAGDAIEGILGDLSTGQAPTQAEWEGKAVALALRWGAPLVLCAAHHLLSDLKSGLVAGPAMDPHRPCKHRVRRELEPFLRYLLARGAR